MADPMMCPCCGDQEMLESLWCNDFTNEGFSLYCEGCGFEIAAACEDWLRRAVLALQEGVATA